MSRTDGTAAARPPAAVVREPFKASRSSIGSGQRHSGRPAGRRTAAAHMQYITNRPYRTSSPTAPATHAKLPWKHNQHRGRAADTRGRTGADLRGLVAARLDSSQARSSICLATWVWMATDSDWRRKGWRDGGHGSGDPGRRRGRPGVSPARPARRVTAAVQRVHRRSDETAAVHAVGGFSEELQGDGVNRLAETSCVD